jgi:hypothetical protein
VKMVVGFTPSLHLKMIASWYEKRGMGFDERFLSPSGSVVEGIAAQFLYKTDGNICFLENLIANPDTDPEERDKAIDDVVKSNIKIAYNCGYNFIIGTTQLLTVAKRAEKLGFRVDEKPYYHTYLEIK